MYGGFAGLRVESTQLDSDQLCRAAEHLCFGTCSQRSWALMGISLFVAFSGLMRLAVAIHADWIRLPMIGVALAGALLNLWVLARLRRLRANPASAWRRHPADTKQLHREKIQLYVALVTIALVALEAGLHLHYHGHI